MSRPARAYKARSTKSASNLSERQLQEKHVELAAARSKIAEFENMDAEAGAEYFETFWNESSKLELRS